MQQPTNLEDSLKRQEELLRLAKEVTLGKRVLAVVGVTWETVPTLFDEVGGALLSGAIGLPVPVLPGVKGYHGFLAVADDQFYFVDLSSGKMKVKTKLISEAKLRYTFHLKPKQCKIQYHTGGNVYRTFTVTEFFGPDNINNGLKVLQFSGRAQELQQEKKFNEDSWQEIVKKVEAKPLREDDFHEITPEQEAQEKYDRRNSTILEVSLSCHRCAAPIKGMLVPWKIWEYCQGGRSDALGYVCKSCQAYLCVSCMKVQGIRFSIWSGFEKRHCSECKQKFGPKAVLLPPGRPELLLKKPEAKAA